MHRLSRDQKILRGTYRASRDQGGIQQVEAIVEVPSAPESLSDLAVKVWDQLAPELVKSGVLTKADLVGLGLLCETHATASELEKTIREEGFTVPTAGGSRKAHPAVNALKSARTACSQMLKEYGLTPASRKHTEKAPAPRVGPAEDTFRDKDWTRDNDDFE